MNISDYIPWFSLILASLGIVYTYTVQRKLNKMQLKEFKDREIKSKQADFKAEIFETGDLWVLSITNIGISDARNVKYKSDDIENDDSIFLRVAEGLFPVSLISPGQSVEIPVMLGSNHRPSYQVFIIWDDEYKKGRTKELTLFV